MKIIFLGTSGSKPSIERNVSSFAIHFGQEVLLFDCGEGTQRQMLKLVKQSRISKIFITHFHGDHYLGIPGLLMTMSLNKRTEPIDIYGPPGCVDFIKNLLSSGYMGIEFEVRVTEMDNSLVTGSGYTVMSFPVDHGVPALGYLFKENDRRGSFNEEKAMALGVEGRMFSVIEKEGKIDINGKTITIEEITGPPKKGKKITYSGDTRHIEFPVETKGSDLLIHEATFVYENERGDTYHSTIKEACLAAIQIDAKKLVLTHINGRYTEEDIIKEAFHYIKDVVVAKDSLEIEV
ncbi:MAG: ribonuclease Z [Candidatus Methanofastidiosia archaeon]